MIKIFLLFYLFIISTFLQASPLVECRYQNLRQESEILFKNEDLKRVNNYSGFEIVTNKKIASYKFSNITVRGRTSNGDLIPDYKVKIYTLERNGSIKPVRGGLPRYRFYQRANYRQHIDSEMNKRIQQFKWIIRLDYYEHELLYKDKIEVKFDLKIQCSD